MMGISTKRDNKNLIGEYGTGVKYALAWMHRNKVDVQLWVDGNPVNMTWEPTEAGGMKFNTLVVEGKTTSITDKMGEKWDGWMALRELYANAVDEGGEMAVTDDYNEFIGEGRTTWIIDDNVKGLADVMKQQDYYMTRGRELFYEDERIKIYHPDSRGRGGFYVKGILVSTDEDNHPGYGYELKKLPYLISEERLVYAIDSAYSLTMGALLKITDPEVVQNILWRSKKVRGSMEQHIFREAKRQLEVRSSFFEIADKATRVYTGGFGTGNILVEKPWSDLVYYEPKDHEMVDDNDMQQIILNENCISAMRCRVGKDYRWVEDESAADLNKRVNLLAAIIKDTFTDLMSGVLNRPINFIAGKSLDKRMKIEFFNGANYYARSEFEHMSDRELSVELLTYLVLDGNDKYGVKFARRMVSDNWENMHQRLEDMLQH